MKCAPRTPELVAEFAALDDATETDAQGARQCNGMDLTGGLERTYWGSGIALIVPQSGHGNSEDHWLFTS